MELMWHSLYLTAQVHLADCVQRIALFLLNIGLIIREYNGIALDKGLHDFRVGVGKGIYTVNIFIPKLLRHLNPYIIIPIAHDMVEFEGGCCSKVSGAQYLRLSKDG